MSRWYRAYAGTVKDDKLAEVAVVVGCSRSVAIAVWHSILESAAEAADGGRFDTTARRVAAALGEPCSVIEQAFAAMAEIGMIEGGAVAAWKRRQYESDTSTDRVRKHRETKRNGDETFQQRSVTPPEAETDTETKEDTASAASSCASAPGIDLIEAERRCAQAAGADRLGSFAPIAELLHRQADLERDVLPAIRARPAAGGKVSSWKFYVPVIAEAMAKRAPPQMAQGPPPVFVAEGSPEWAAWQAAEPGKYRAMQTKIGFGYYFPSRRPPTTIPRKEQAA
jgi:hypothetical protein